jgi:putative colanic acid biosynthesis acetyltransferase WcaF
MPDSPQRTQPHRFHNPHTRGNKLARLTWALVYATLFRPSPWFMGPWRNTLLRLFGAKLRGFVRIKPTVRVWAPWLLEVGDNVYLDERVHVYNPFGVTLGDRVIVSQGTFLCSATHDHTDPRYALCGGRITVQDDAWIAAEVFVGPGVTIGSGAVVGARTVAVKDVPPWKVVAGNPARIIKDRVLTAAPTAEDQPR